MRWLACGIILFCLPSAGCALSPLARYERSLIYQPAPADVGDWSPPADLGFENAEFTASDGTQLHGWFVDHPQRRAVVLFMHGNGGNVAVWASSLHYLSQRHQVAAMVFDYRGYGQSEGQPTEE